MADLLKASPEMTVEYGRWFVNRRAYCRQSDQPHRESGRLLSAATIRGQSVQHPGHSQGRVHRSTSIPGTGYSATPSVLPPTRSTYPTSPGHTRSRTTPTTSRPRRRAARALRPTGTSSTHGNSNSMIPSRAAPPANGAQHILPASGVARPTATTGPGQASIRASVQVTASSSRGRSVRPTNAATRSSTTRTSTTVPDRRCVGSTNRSARPKRHSRPGSGQAQPVHPNVRRHQELRPATS